jgi:quinohemoprotein ethanol dehydrogenase
MVFKLGCDGILPDVPETNFALPTIPALLDVSDEVVAKGKRVYANNCMTCHGAHAYSSGLIPNLRFSPITANKQAWHKVVAGGALAQQGMPNFGEVFDDETIEAVRAYVISEANSDRDEGFYQSMNN